MAFTFQNREYLIYTLFNITGCNISNDAIILNNHRKIINDVQICYNLDNISIPISDDIHIDYVYFTHVSKELYVTLFSHNNIYYLIQNVKETKKISMTFSIDFEKIFKSLPKTIRKNTLNIIYKNKVTSADYEKLSELISKFQPFDFCHMTKTEKTHYLNKRTIYFDISNIISITDEDIIDIDINETITHLNLYNNTGISDVAIFMNKFPNLTNISIIQMKHIGDNQIENMQLYKHKCTNLDLTHTGCTIRVLLYCTTITTLCINDLNTPCQVNMYETLISDSEWESHKSACKKLIFISNNLTIDCIKYICEKTHDLQDFTILECIIDTLRTDTKSGYERDFIIFHALNNNSKKLQRNRDIRWFKLLKDNCDAI